MGTKRGTLAAASMDKGEAKSMESIRFLHCADLHLGAELSSLGNLASSRREELFMTFERILSICREEKPDFLLMAGDVFDTDAPEPSLSLRVKEGLASIPEKQLIIAPGNHDYLSARSPYLTQWSPNVHIFSRDVYCFPFPEKGVYVQRPSGVSADARTETVSGAGAAVLERIRDLSVETITPIEAMTLLYEMKKELGDAVAQS